MNVEIAQTSVRGHGFQRFSLWREACLKQFSVSWGGVALSKDSYGQLKYDPLIFSAGAGRLNFVISIEPV